MERSAVFEDVNLQLLQLCVGTIVEVSHDGCSVRIGPVQGVVRELTCDLLTSCGGDVGTPCVVMGDKVLVWPFAESGRGVVLGRVGTPARSSGEIAKPEDELVIEAKRNLTLKCGDGSITIREDGKILIKGTELVSHAKQANRIKGGSVAIN
jgi:hypothetical protein